MYQKKKIAVVMPCLNEEGKIGSSVRRLKKSCKGLVDIVIVVDDGSKDRTGSDAKKAGAVVLVHSTNLGAGAACRTGFYHALRRGYDVVVLMAGDDQDDPKDVLPIVKKLVTEKFDYVHGSRWTKGGKRVSHPLSRSVLTRVYSVLFSLMSGFPASDATNGFRAFCTAILENPRMHLNQTWLNRYELEPYFFYNVIRLGYSVGEIPVTKKYHTEMKLNTKMVSLASFWSILRPIILVPLGIKQ